MDDDQPSQRDAANLLATDAAIAMCINSTELAINRLSQAAREISIALLEMMKTNRDLNAAYEHVSSVSDHLRAAEDAMAKANADIGTLIHARQ